MIVGEKFEKRKENDGEMILMGKVLRRPKGVLPMKVLVKGRASLLAARTGGVEAKQSRMHSNVMGGSMVLTRNPIWCSG